MLSIILSVTANESSACVDAIAAVYIAPVCAAKTPNRKEVRSQIVVGRSESPGAQIESRSTRHFGETMAQLRQFLILCCLLPWAAGCRRPDDLSVEGRYDNLPGLKLVQHRGLLDELARIRDERATPWQLHQSQFEGLEGADNAANDLLKILTTNELHQVQSQLRVVFPIERERSPGMKFELRRLTDRYSRALNSIHEALQKPYCRFPIQHARGILADEKWLDQVEVLLRLEIVAIVAQGDVGDFNAALLHILDFLNLAAHVASEPHLTARVKGAQLRVETIDRITEIIENPRFDAIRLSDLAVVIDQELANWPHDSVAWIGERAQGIHAFELIRDGHLETLLTERETIVYQDVSSPAQPFAESLRDVDQVEFWYLNAMRQLINLNDQLYSDREPLLAELRQRLDRMNESGKLYRIISSILLADIEAGEMWQARDRATFESLAASLHAALSDFPVPRESR